MILKSKPIFGKPIVLPAQFGVFLLALIVTGFSLLAQFVPSVYSYYYYSVSGLSFSENSKRIELIQHATEDPSVLSSLTQDEMKLVLLEPALIRKENNIKAVHYYSENCAIDVYFMPNSDRPDYIEFRALTLKQDQGGMDNRYCFQSVLAAQGVDTPNSYATRPLPTWISPYSS